MGLTLLDTSALSGYLDADDALHEVAATCIEAALRGGSGLAVSAVSWAELLNGAKQGHHDERAIREFAADFGLRVLPVDVGVAEMAAELQAGNAGAKRRHDAPRLRTPDALILATAQAHDDIQRVITGERKWAGVPGIDVTVEICSPPAA